MDKKPCAKFFGILISFNEVMMFQSFEFDISDIIPASVQNISLQVFFHIFFFILCRMSFQQNFMVFFTIFQELIKLQNLND